MDILVLFSALIIPHQIAGVFLIRVYMRSDSSSEIADGAWRSFVDVLGGALVGLVLPLITISVLIGIALFLGTLPFSLAIVVFYFIYKRNKGVHSASAPTSPHQASELPP